MKQDNIVKKPKTTFTKIRFKDKLRAKEERRKREQSLKVIKYVAFFLGILMTIAAVCIIVNSLR